MTPRAFIAWQVQKWLDFLGWILELVVTCVVCVVKGIIWTAMQIYARLVGDK